MVCQRPRRAMRRVAIAVAIAVMPVGCSPAGDTDGDAGHVTYADYERAVHEAIQCINEDTLFEVVGPHTYLTAPGWLTIIPGHHPGDFIMFDMREPAGADRDEVMEQLDVADECVTRLLYDTESAWHRQRDPTEADLRLWYDAAAECMRDHGAELPDDPQPADIESVIDYRLCQPWDSLPDR